MGVEERRGVDQAYNKERPMLWPCWEAKGDVCLLRGGKVMALRLTTSLLSTLDP